MRPCRQSLPGDYGTLGLEPSELERHIAYDIGACGRHARHGRARSARRRSATRFSRLLIDPNRGARRPDPDHAPVRRRRHRRQPPHRRRASATSACGSTTSPITQAIAGLIETCTGGRRAAGTAVDAQLHRAVEGRAAALACRRAVGSRSSASPCRCSRRLRAEPAIDRRRQRALRRRAGGRLHVAARHAARPRAYASSRCART